MKLTRRRLFGILPAAGVVAALPDKATADPVRPIILEHVCDGGKSRYTPEEFIVARTFRSFWGCGTRFQWHWGVNPYCPKCGWAYLCTVDDLKSSVYRRVS
jgi:hypothetical protein